MQLSSFLRLRLSSTSSLSALHIFSFAFQALRPLVTTVSTLAPLSRQGKIGQRKDSTSSVEMVLLWKDIKLCSLKITHFTQILRLCLVQDCWIQTAIWCLTCILNCRGKLLEYIYSYYRMELKLAFSSLWFNYIITIRILLFKLGSGI
jgi:hypothetical protein